MVILYLYKRKSISQNVLLWVNLYGAEKVNNSKYKVYWFSFTKDFNANAIFLKIVLQFFFTNH